MMGRNEGRYRFAAQSKLLCAALKPASRLLLGSAGAFCRAVSDRARLRRPGGLRGVEFPVALFDAASPFVSGKDDADVVWASAFACSGDFLLRFAGCQGKDLIPQGRCAALAASWFSGRSTPAGIVNLWHRDS